MYLQLSVTSGSWTKLSSLRFIYQLFIYLVFDKFDVFEYPTTDETTLQIADFESDPAERVENS